MLELNLPNPNIARLWQRGAEFLGCPLAIMGGAMTWLSERNLVAALSNQGAFGVLASGSMTPALLEQEIAATLALTNRPFGVNLIVMNPHLMELAQVCVQANISHVVLAGGNPPLAVIQYLKEHGVRVIAFAPALILAKRLIQQGVDALVVEGSEAGGHIGNVSTGVLAQEILPVIDQVPVFVAGGIGRGEAIVSYLQMGAAGVQLATRFVVADECIAHPKFKDAFVRAHARDATTSVQVDPHFPVIAVRSIANQASNRFVAWQHEVIGRHQRGELTMKEAQLEIEHFWAGALRRAVIDGDTENGSLMAGQSVAFVTKKQPLAEILAELLAQMEYSHSSCAPTTPSGFACHPSKKGN
jgi:enoyl-[acyl-carrier protein] reductase II